jgi:hypothetical protein
MFKRAKSYTRRCIPSCLFMNCQLRFRSTYISTQTARQNTSNRLRRGKRSDDSNYELVRTWKETKVLLPWRDWRQLQKISMWIIVPVKILTGQKRYSLSFLDLHPEDGGNTSLHNTGTHLSDHILSAVRTSGKFYLTEYKRNVKSSRRGTVRGWFRRNGILVLEHGNLQTCAVGTRKCQ